ncbi:MAG: gliding motility protein GldL [Paludibacteraceae bacterium]|nr:gliding motility protein GldL [Paludibacteraceae bacterium]
MAKRSFDEWWASPSTKRVVGAVYSLGASVVIIGAMFKILHLPGANITLGAGMVTEAFLFFIGVFDKAPAEYHWDRVFPVLTDASAESNAPAIGGSTQVNGIHIASGNGANSLAGVANTPALDQAQADKLASGIKRLSETADQLANISSVAAASDKLGKNIEAAATATQSFVASQTNLSQSYATIAEGMNRVAGQTTNYASNVEAANAHLTSINSVYELQLKNIQSQAELFGQQSQKLSAATQSLDQVAAEVVKLQQATLLAAQEGEKYKAGISQLSQHISDLNKVYGNMLNALN